MKFYLITVFFFASFNSLCTKLTAQDKLQKKSGFLFLSKYNFYYNDPYSTGDVVSERSFSDIFFEVKDIDSKSNFLNFLNNKTRTGIVLNSFPGRDSIFKKRAVTFSNDTTGLSYCYRENEFYVIPVKITYVDRYYDYGVNYCPSNYGELKVKGKKFCFKFKTISIEILSITILKNK